MANDPKRPGYITASSEPNTSEFVYAKVDPPSDGPIDLGPLFSAGYAAGVEATKAKVKRAYNLGAGDMKARMEAKYAGVAEAFKSIKSLVCGDKRPNWESDYQTTKTRGIIADVCDIALRELGVANACKLAGPPISKETI